MKPPCINCLKLPICRTKYITNNDNATTRLMKVRFAIHGCEEATDYVYIEKKMHRKLNEYEEWVAVSVMTYNISRTTQILTYFENF